MTALCLLVSSSVPAAAGVQVTLGEVLCHGGAAADGPQDECTVTRQSAENAR
ncbi:hypothetical protein [Trebonia kvetii]|uniref:hypothetical protein n=1 Tax=Trebonia kvetii TaxID=2480626 RepID=UPI001652AECF|nr:hypothetical protein [Trebonia kvetii]